MSKQKAKKYCIAAGCRNNNKNSNATFFRLPPGQSEEDRIRCHKWLKLLGREDILDNNYKINSYTVCSAHFDSSSIKTIRTLKNDAIPTLLLANQPHEEQSCSTSEEPKSKDAVTQTIQNCETDSYRVCSAHFDPSSIKTIQTLEKTAIPSLLLAKQSHKEPPCLTSETSTKFEDELSETIHDCDTEGQTIKEEALENPTQSSILLTDGTSRKRKPSDGLKKWKSKERRINRVVIEIKQKEDDTDDEITDCL